MAGLLFLSILTGIALVCQADLVPQQDEDSVVHECGQDGQDIDLYPRIYNFNTIIKSYNFGSGTYRNSENCQVRFWTDEYPLLLTVQFRSFDLEMHSQCRYDYLCVNGVYFCGSWEVGKNFTYLVPANSSFTLRFASDYSVVRSGFEVKVEVEIADVTTPHDEIASGYGSAENLLVVRQSNPDQYEDRCYRNNTEPPPAPWYDSTVPPYTSNYYTDQSYVYGTTNNPFYRDTTGYNYGTTNNPYYRDTTGYDYGTTNSPYYRDTNGYNYGTTNNPYYRDTTGYNYGTTNNPYYRDTTGYNYGTTNNPYYRDTTGYNYGTTNNPYYRDTTGYNYGTTNNPYYRDTTGYNYGTTNSPYYRDTTGYNYGTTNNPYYRDTTGYDYGTTNSPYYRDTNGYNYGTTNNPYYRDTTGYNYGTTNNPYYRDTTGYNYGTTNNPYYRDTTGYNYGTTNNPYYRDTTGYNYGTTNNPYYRDTTYYNYGTTNSPYYPYTRDYNYGTTTPEMNTPVIYCRGIEELSPNSGNVSYVVRSGREGYGTIYSDNEQCSVVFRTSDIPKVFTVTFNSFDLEHNSRCTYDSLCLKGVSFCGNWESGYSFTFVVPAFQTFTLAFKSDGSNTGTGFEVRVDARDTDSFASLYEVSSGYGSSPDQINYQWSNQMNYQDICAHGSSTPSYYGTTDYNYGTTNYHTTWGYPWTTDSSYRTTSYPYRTRTYSYETTSNPWVNTPVIYCREQRMIDIHSGNSSYIVRSGREGYGTSYSDNEQCSVVFKTSYIPKVFTVTFNSLNLEYQAQCTYDSLCLKGVKFCGNWESGQSFSFAVPMFERFTLAFSSDNSNTGTGFEVRVDVQDSFGSVYEPAGGYGSSLSQMNYQWSNPRNYLDICAYSSSTPSYYGTKDYNYGTTNYDYRTTDNGYRTTNYPYRTSTYSYGTTRNPWTHSTTITQCYQTSSSSVFYPTTVDNRFIIRSSNFPNDGVYESGAVCEITFRTVDTPLVLYLRFSAFDVETAPSCVYDWLCVNGIKFCSNWTVGRDFTFAVPAYNSFTIKFITDGSTVGKGFEIDLMVEELLPNENVYVVIGASQEFGVTNEHFNSYEYQDKCRADTSATTSSYFTTAPSYNHDDSTPRYEPKTPGYWDVSTIYPSFITEHLHVIQRMIQAAQDRLSYAYDLLASLF